MILHLLRKFTAPTETFIVDQIKATFNLDPIVFTISNLANLEVEARVVATAESNYLATKFLSNKSIHYFKILFNEICPNVIHSHYLTDASYFHPFTKDLQVPKICSCYGYDVSSFPKKYGLLANVYFQRVFKEYQYFLAMSEVMRKDLLSLGCPENKILVHYYGVNTKAFDVERDYLNTSSFTLLTIARLHPMKGHLTVLKALVKIKGLIPGLKYHIVGNGDFENVLRKFVDQNGLSGFVYFHEGIKHGPGFNKYLEGADVFLHPSEVTDQGAKEGIPGAIVEAMSSGLPVIASRHGGIPYVIHDNSTGFLVDEKDVSSIAEKIMLLYKDVMLRKRIGENAKEYAISNLDLFKKAKQLELIYSLSKKNSKIDAEIA